MPSYEQSWQPEVNWQTPAGRLLDRLVEALPEPGPWRFIVFGSAPIQLGIDAEFLSGDVDLIATVEVESYCRRAGLLKGQSATYVDLCTAAAFTASPDWIIRACEVPRRHSTFILPHPIDILVSKISRLEEKDVNAFRAVRKRTGHPTEEELIVALRRVVDIYRPSFDEESSGNPRIHTELLWQELFGKTINVPEQIIAPAIAERKKSYGGENYGFREALNKLGGSI